MDNNPIETLFQDFAENSNDLEMEKEREQKRSEINTDLYADKLYIDKVAEEVDDLQYAALRSGFYAGFRMAIQIMKMQA